MRAARLAIAAIGVAVAVSRHPATRAALKAAPSLVPDSAKQAAYDSAKHAAYNAGVIARRVVPRRIL